MQSTGDASAIVSYLASKYLHDDEFNLAFEAERLAKLSHELSLELQKLKERSKPERKQP